MSPTRSLGFAVLVVPTLAGCPGEAKSTDSSADSADSADTAANLGDTAADSGDSGVLENRESNRGTLAWTVEFSDGVTHRLYSVADLDQDGRDEVLVDQDGGGVLVLSLDAVAGTASALPAAGLPGPVYDVAALGNGQVLLVGDDENWLAEFTQLEGVGWVASRMDAFGAVEDIERVGDLDGDGRDDVLVQQDSRDPLEIIPGPIAASGNAAILTLTNEVVSRLVTGDLNGDGYPDLVVSTSGWLTHVVYGPIASGTVAEGVEELAASHITELYGSAVGVLADLDGDGTGELVSESGLVYDGLVPGTVDPPPQSFLSDVISAIPRHHASSIARYADGDGLASWWVGLPDVRGRYLADATIVCLGGGSRQAFGRFGSSTEIDFVCVEQVIRAVPGWGGHSGGDVDRDGFAAPEDCDEAVAAVHPEAFDVTDGVDNDCDGLTDEVASEVWLPVASATGDAPLGGSTGVEFEVAAFDDGWVPLPETYRSATIFDYDAASGALRSGGSSARERAGDLDGDGYGDLLGYQGIIYGPGAAWESLTPRGVRYGESWDFEPLGDLDGDGDAELWFEWYYHDDLNNLNVGEWGVIAGGEGRNEDPVVAGWGEGLHPYGTGDVDGDGNDDLLLPTGEIRLGPAYDSAQFLPADSLGTLSRTDGGLALYEIQFEDVDGDRQVDVISPRADGGLDVTYGPLAPGATNLDITATFSLAGGVLAWNGVAWPLGGELLFVADPGVDQETGRVYGFTVGASPASVDEAAVTLPGATPGARFGAGGTLVDLVGQAALVLVAPGAAGAIYDEGTTYTFVRP